MHLTERSCPTLSLLDRQRLAENTLTHLHAQKLAQIVMFRLASAPTFRPFDLHVSSIRERGNTVARETFESIDHVGLLKPIRVNDKFLERTGMYELICGEGRLLAHRTLGRSQVVAEVVTCTRKEAYLQSLVENIARTSPRSMDFARELKRLHDEGWNYKKIAAIAESHHIKIAPHNHRSPVATAACVQLGTSTSNWDVLEAHDEAHPPHSAVVRKVTPLVDGYFIAPDTPGIGVEFDDSAPAKYPFEPMGGRPPIREDGSVALQ